MQTFKLDAPKLGMRGTCFIRNGGWWLRFTDPATPQNAAGQSQDD
jgi:hypothetical protein